MSNEQLPMDNYQWTMSNEQLPMDKNQWTMINFQCSKIRLLENWIWKL